MTDGNPKERLSWASPEFAWPLAIAAGFLGTYLGVLVGFPLAPAILAVAAFAPIFLRLQSYRRVGVAFLASMAWIVGILGALVGVAVEQGLGPVFVAVPLAEAFAAAEWSAPPGGEGTVRLGALVRNLLVFGGVVVLARPFAGILALGLAGLSAGYLGAGMADYAVRMAVEGWSPSHAGIMGCPPHLLLPLLFGLAAACTVASPGRLLPLSDLTGLRRRLFVWGAVGGPLVLLLEPVLAPLWRDTLG